MRNVCLGIPLAHLHISAYTTGMPLSRAHAVSAYLALTHDHATTHHFQICCRTNRADALV